MKTRYQNQFGASSRNDSQLTDSSFLIFSPGAKFRFLRSVAPPCEQVIYALLDMPLPGNFRNLGHWIEAKRAQTMWKNVEECDSN